MIGPHKLTANEVSLCLFFKLSYEQEAISWLQSTTSEAGLKYREFLIKHGHRCLREVGDFIL